jgi:nucleoside-diphosphate-sugar epimerase
MRQLVALVEAAAGQPIDIEWQQAQLGDVRRTGAEVSAIKDLCGWAPTTTIEEGVRMHVEFERTTTLESWRGCK